MRRRKRVSSEYIYICLRPLRGMTNDTAGASARAPRGSSGLPAGITKARKRYQARLSYVPTGSTKKEMRPIGTFDTVDEAVAALAEAQTKYAAGGEAAVWQKEKEQRAPRGSVRITCPHVPAHCWHTLREHSTSADVLRWCAQRKSRSRSRSTWLRCPVLGAATTRLAATTCTRGRRRSRTRTTGLRRSTACCPPPSTMSAVRQCLLSSCKTGPWAALFTAMDGSGELCM